MLRTTVGGSSSKNEEPCSLIDDEEALKNFQKMEDDNEQLPLKDKDTTAINIELQGNYSSGLRHRSVSSPGRAKVPNVTVTEPPDEEERHESQGLISSQFFSYICSIYKEEGFGETDSYQKINSPYYKKQELKNCEKERKDLKSKFYFQVDTATQVFPNVHYNTM